MLAGAADCVAAERACSARSHRWPTSSLQIVISVALDAIAPATYGRGDDSEHEKLVIMVDAGASRVVREMNRPRNDLST
jgi:hypothetical protein